MTIIKGDLIQYGLKGKFDLIVHGCNCFCTMEAGIAKSIKHIFPEAYEADMKTKKGDKEKLGTISWAKIEREHNYLIVVNGYTQYHYQGEGRLVNYEAIRQVFRHIKTKFSGMRMGYPMIGAGLGGGDWEIISRIIDEELLEEEHVLVIYQPMA